MPGPCPNTLYNNGVSSSESPMILKDPQWHLSIIEFYLNMYSDSFDIWSYFTSTQIYLYRFHQISPSKNGFLNDFVIFFPSFCVNFPEILRWKDLGCATASPKAAPKVGGGGAGGASSDFAVMDLKRPWRTMGIPWVSWVQESPKQNDWNVLECIGNKWKVIEYIRI